MTDAAAVLLPSQPPQPSSSALPPTTLHRLLFGEPLSDRDPEDGDASGRAVGESLDGVVSEIIELLREEHTNDSRAFRQAERELSEVRDMPNTDPNAIACKRGILLFTLWREPTFADRFRTSDGPLVADLTKRVLPVIAPPFLANLGQRPDSFVALCVTLSTLWAGEPFALVPVWDKGTYTRDATEAAGTTGAATADSSTGGRT